jgi:hypothetical protein
MSVNTLTKYVTIAKKLELDSVEQTDSDIKNSCDSHYIDGLAVFVESIQETTFSRDARSLIASVRNNEDTATSDYIELIEHCIPYAAQGDPRALIISAADSYFAGDFDLVQRLLGRFLEVEDAGDTTLQGHP